MTLTDKERERAKLERKLTGRRTQAGSQRALSALLQDDPEALERMPREELMKLAMKADDDGYHPAMFREVEDGEIDEITNKLGRPPKFSLARVQIILNAITSGMPADYAAVEAGIDETTFYDWMRKYPKFAALVFEAQAARFRHYMTKIAKNADFNPIAAAIILERLDPKHFGRKDKVEHTVEVSGGVDVRHVLVDPHLIDIVSELEQRLQAGEIIEGEAREITALPEHLEDES